MTEESDLSDWEWEKHCEEQEATRALFEKQWHEWQIVTQATPEKKPKPKKEHK